MCLCVYTCTYVCLRVYVSLYHCQFTRVQCLPGHEDWVRDVQFCRESESVDRNTKKLSLMALCVDIVKKACHSIAQE